MFETIFTFTVFGVTVHGSLGSIDMRDNAIGWGHGAGADKIRKESGADSGVSEVSFGCEFFLFSFVFLQVQF